MQVEQINVFGPKRKTKRAICRRRRIVRVDDARFCAPRLKNRRRRSRTKGGGYLRLPTGGERRFKIVAPAASKARCLQMKMRSLVAILLVGLLVASIADAQQGSLPGGKQQR